MTIKILVYLISGILCGMFLLPSKIIAILDPITTGALGLLLFSVGFSLGTDQELKEKIKSLPRITLAVPFVIALGSIVGPWLTASLVKLTRGEAALVGAGFGWYSLSSIIISQTYDVGLGTLALLSNIFRELLAFLLTPLIAKKVGNLPAVALGGATTMDVTLPIVAKNTDPKTTLVAFYSGTVLTILVPLVLSLLLRFV